MTLFPLDSIPEKYRNAGNVLTEEICEIVRPIILKTAGQILTPTDWRHTDVDEVVNEMLIHTVWIIERYRVIEGISFSPYFRSSIQWKLKGWNSAWNRNYRTPSTRISYISHDTLLEHLANVYQPEAGDDFPEAIALRDMLERLPLIDRTLIVLHVLYQYSFREIAEILEISVGVVFAQYQRARNHARKLLAAGLATSHDLTTPRPSRSHPDILPREYVFHHRISSAAFDKHIDPSQLSSQSRRSQHLYIHPDATEVAR